MTDPDRRCDKTYLGDSVYVQFDGWMLTLTTNNGYSDDPRNVIHLEPEVFSALLDYVTRIRDAAAGKAE